LAASTVTWTDGTTVTICNGASQVMVARADHGDIDCDMITVAVGTAVTDVTVHRYQPLDVARAGGDGRWKFLGAPPLFEPRHP
jgi:hypothetical protein